MSDKHKAEKAQPECERTASCEPGDHTYSWPCALAAFPTETDQYRAVLGLMLENVHIAVSNDDIVVEDVRFPAPAHLRATLATLMEEWVDGEVNDTTAAALDDAGRCPFRNAHYLTNRAVTRDDGWRCGKEAGHVNGHYLYSADGEHVLDTMGPWVLPPEVVTPPGKDDR